MNILKNDFKDLKKSNKNVFYGRSIFLQGLLVLIVSIYSIISFGSGLKQVYLLRNIEVVLLIVSLTFGTSILGGV